MSVTPYPAEAERLQLTVMFCDLVDYTPLSETLDPEELAIGVRAVGEIADTWDERLRDALGGRRPLVD